MLLTARLTVNHHQYTRQSKTRLYGVAVTDSDMKNNTRTQNI